MIRLHRAEKLKTLDSSQEFDRQKILLLDEKEALLKKKLEAEGNTGLAIVDNLDLKSLGELISVFNSEENGEAIKKYSAELEALKKASTDIVKNVLGSKDLKQGLANINLDSLLDIAKLEGSDSNLGLTAKSMAVGGKLVKNGLSMWVKLGQENKTLNLNGATINKGENRFQKFNDYGELVDRNISDCLSQLGINEMLDMMTAFTMFDETGTATKYFVNFKTLTTESTKLADNIIAYMKSKKKNELGQEDSDGLQKILDIADTSEMIKALANMFPEDSKVQEYTKQFGELTKESTKIIRNFCSDRDIVDKLYSLELDGLVNWSQKFDRESFVNYCGKMAKAGTKLYKAGYQSVYQVIGIRDSLKYFLTGNEKKTSLFETQVENIYQQLKDKKVVGGFVEKMKESGALLGTVQTANLLYENVGNFVDLFNAGKGLYKLNKDDKKEEARMYTDRVNMVESFEKLDSQLGDDFALSNQEKQKVRKAADRNYRLVQSGNQYAYNEMYSKGINASVKLVASAVKRLLDPMGIGLGYAQLAAGAIEELVGSTLTYILKTMVDGTATLNYLLTSNEAKEMFEALRNEDLNKAVADNASDDVKAQIAARSIKDYSEKIRTALGLKEDMELRTYVGRRISYSVLFSATDQNPLESTQGTARTILEALGCSDLIGKTDEASCTRLYEALIGSMGINLSSIAPKPGVIDGKDLHIYRHKIKTAVKESTIPKKAIA